LAEIILAGGWAERVFRVARFGEGAAQAVEGIRTPDDYGRFSGQIRKRLLDWAAGNLK
jgi:hypothetical protein